MTSSNEQIMAQLNRLSLVFEPPMAKTINGQPNPKYGALVAVYVESLQPFQPWELEAGTKLALESHKFARWPKPAELRNYCLEAQRSAKPRTVEPPKYLQQPDKPRVSQEVRERVAFKLQVLRDWQANGNLMAKNPDGTYRHSLQDCIAEASTRQQAWNHKLAQKQERRRA